MTAGPLHRFPAARAFGFAAALAAAGCVSKPPLATQSYTIDPPPSRAVEVQPAAATVSLSSVRVTPPYNGTSFVYRTTNHGIERDPYALFASPPGWMLTSAIGGYLRDSGFVRDVVYPGDGIPVAAAIEVEAVELCAELDAPGGASSILTLRFRVVAPPAGLAARREILQKTYTARVPMTQRTAAAAADAWNRALAKIMEEFLADLKGSLAPR